MSKEKKYFQTNMNMFVKEHKSNVDLIDCPNETEEKNGLKKKFILFWPR